MGHMGTHCGLFWKAFLYPQSHRMAFLLSVKASSKLPVPSKHVRNPSGKYSLPGSQSPLQAPLSQHCLADLGAEPPRYPRRASIGQETLCRQGHVIPTSSTCTMRLLNCIRHHACLLTQHNGTLCVGWVTVILGCHSVEHLASGIFTLLFPVCWLAFLSSQAVKLPEASPVPSEGLPETSPETF